MKYAYLLIVFFVCLSTSYAQTMKYGDVMPLAAAQQLYPRLKNARDTKNPSIQALIALKYATKLAENFTADTLYKYDWGHLRAFHFEDSPDDPIYSWQFANFEISRFAYTKTTEAFDIVDNNGKLALTFIRYANSKSYGVSKIGQYYYIVNEEDGKKTYARIVQYQKGILIYDVSITGTIKSFDNSNRIFRRVMVALPKSF